MKSLVFKVMVLKVIGSQSHWFSKVSGSLSFEETESQWYRETVTLKAHGLGTSALESNDFFAGMICTWWVSESYFLNKHVLILSGVEVYGSRTSRYTDAAKHFILAKEVDKLCREKERQKHTSLLKRRYTVHALVCGSRTTLYIDAAR